MAAAAPVVVVLGSVVQPDPLAPNYRGNPLAVPALARVLVVPAVAGVVVVLVSPAGRGRVAGGALPPRPRVERQQLRWLAYAAALAAGLLLVALVAAFVLAKDEVVTASLALGVALLPLATGAAILRYRLYDLDRIISRTLAYGLLTVLLGGGYATVVLVLGPLLGQDSSLVVAGATLAVAAVFQRPAAASSTRSTGASTAAATTPPARSRHSAPASATSLTWTRSRPRCWRWWSRPCSRPRRGCGCAPHEASRAASASVARQRS